MLSSLSMGVVIGEKEAVARFVSLGARLSCVFGLVVGKFRENVW